MIHEIINLPLSIAFRKDQMAILGTKSRESQDISVLKRAPEATFDGPVVDGSTLPSWVAEFYGFW